MRPNDQMSPKNAIVKLTIVRFKNSNSFRHILYSSSFPFHDFGIPLGPKIIYLKRNIRKSSKPYKEEFLSMLNVAPKIYVNNIRLIFIYGQFAHCFEI